MFRTILLFLTAFGCALFLCDFGFAQEVSQVAAEVVKAPTFLDGVLKWMADNLSAPVVSGVVIVAEILLRVFPSSKPLSVLIPIRYACQKVSIILGVLGDIVDKLIVSANNAPKV